MSLNFLFFLVLCSFKSILTQRCQSSNICYGYGDPHYIRFDHALFSLSQNCKVVLLADDSNYNGAFTITTIPFQDTLTNAISIDSIRIKFGQVTYIADELGLKVNGADVNLPFSDSNINAKLNAQTLEIDANQFYLTFGNAFLKLVSCGSTVYGLCASTEADPYSMISNYSPIDQFWDGNVCLNCPADWSPFNGRCFRKFDSQLAQKNAENDCIARNSTLANANSDEKFNFIQSLVPTGSAFLSATATFPLSFKYADGSTNVLKWNTAEPNNGAYSTSLNEGCVELTKSGLNDVSCSLARPYICEMNL